MCLGMLILYKPAYYMQSFALRENMGSIKITQILLQTKKENCLQVNVKIRKYINMTRNQNQQQSHCIYHFIVSQNVSIR
jgi:hypothetical protein